jgi:2C-methyl-D-erythritol 2,4-cyclodiphosphate synthase
MGYIGELGGTMSSKAAPLPSSRSPAGRGRREKPIEVTALVAARPLSIGELKRASRALAAEGFAEMRATRIVLTRNDARAVREGKEGPITAKIVRERADRLTREGRRADKLSEALAAARSRGDAVKQDLLADPEMLSTAAIADRLAMSEEGIRLKRKRHEILGLEFAKRGIRYPAWQVLEDRQIVPGLARLFAVLGGDPWRVFRFLQQRHSELGGGRAIDVLRHGRVDAVIAAAENTAIGAFA